MSMAVFTPSAPDLGLGRRAMNRLSGESSPYLRQHQHNPVDWYPWGDEAFAAAQARGVPILVSIGYSACHWCHVMAHECFEDDEVAARMNELFVNVKVDREERPDVDALYMTSVQALTGSGGWPLTAFLTPSGQPFYGGTYFPKAQFVSLINTLDMVWRDKPEDINKNVTALHAAISRSASLTPAAIVPGAEAITVVLGELGKSFDDLWGGFGGAPKFPNCAALELLLRAHAQQPSDNARLVLYTSLDAMASGGIYDHLAGGFARYATDRQWDVPHFEKMLYDQAQLIRLYVHAWQVFAEERWRQVVEETIGFVLNELADPEGGFYSALDADSLDANGASHEGAYYVWTTAQLEAVLGSDSALRAGTFWQVTAEGNFHRANVLSRSANRGDLRRSPEIEAIRARLLAARATRPRPGLDDKVLTEWNAMFLGALCEAAAAFARRDWLDAATKLGGFLDEQMRDDDGRWCRSWHADGQPRARHRAMAMDIAQLIDAYTRLAEASGEAHWLYLAMDVADELLDRYWDLDHGGVFITADDATQLVVRQKDIIDDAIPSANSVAAMALYRLAALTDEQRYANLADQILQLLASVIASTPRGAAHAAGAVDVRTSGVQQIVVAGDRPDLVASVARRYLPNSVLAWGERYDSPLWAARPDGFAYVCRSFACELPVDSVEGLQALL